VPFPLDADEATTIARAIVPRAAAVVTVEKIGRSADGGYVTAYGTNVREHLAKIDLLVDAAREAGVLTIGIGDLGNEIGMGLIADAVAEYVPNGRSIASVVRTDCLIVGGCSNWGAYGVAASIAAMRRRVDLLHTPEIEREMILECCRAGAVDGLSAAPILAVDGLAWTIHATVVQLLRDLVVVSTDDRPTERQRFE
jgi:hypothetical protein